MLYYQGSTLEPIEQTLINLLLFDNSLLKEIPLQEDDFNEPIFKKCFQIISEEIQSKRVIDIVLLGRKLVGSGFPLSEIIMNECAPSFVSSAYFRELRNETMKRKTQDILRGGLTGEKSYKEIQDDLHEVRKLDKTVFSGGESLLKEMIESIHSRRNKKITLPTGFIKSDQCLGLERGWLVTLAARSSIGKSAIAMNMAVNMARGGLNVLVFSLEMNRVEYMNRVFGQLSGISNTNWKYGNVSDDVIDITSKEFTKFQDNITIRYGSNFDSEEIIRDIYSYGKADVVIIDYLQLIGDKEERGETRTNMIGKITRKFKEVAIDMNCVMIQLSQVSRQATQNENKMPSLEQLRDSGSIEQDSDVVMILNREERDSKQGILRVAKNRHGTVGDIDLWFDPDICLFSEK